MLCAVNYFFKQDISKPSGFQKKSTFASQIIWALKVYDKLNKLDKYIN